MKKIYYFLIIVCMPFLTLAQLTGEIRGKVFDANSKEILHGTNVFVEIMGKKTATIADTNGHFEIKPLNPGTYNVYYTYIGYDTLMINSVKVYSDKDTYLKDAYLSLSPTILVDTCLSAIINLTGLTISEFRSELITIDDPWLIINYENIFKEMADARTLAGALRGFCSGVFVGERDNEIYFRGSRNGDAVYYVDGVKTRDSDLHIPGNAIKSMTVYMGGVPANYGDFTGGVVVVETQSYFSWLNERKARSYPTVKYVIHQTQEQ